MCTITLEEDDVKRGGGSHFLSLSVSLSLSSPASSVRQREPIGSIRAGAAAGALVIFFLLSLSLSAIGKREGALFTLGALSLSIHSKGR